MGGPTILEKNWAKEIASTTDEEKNKASKGDSESSEQVRYSRAAYFGLSSPDLRSIGHRHSRLFRESALHADTQLECSITACSISKAIRGYM
jgi:hypothetical protein